MSAVEEHQEAPRSSVTISLNSKGLGQISIKRYVGDTDDDLRLARENAQAEFEAGMQWLAKQKLAPA